jgi:hypothetical protein
VATPRTPLLLASAASGVLALLASAAPSGLATGVDNVVVRMDVGTARWSETNGSFLTASTGLIVSAADAPFRISNPAAFAFIPLGGAAALQGLPYQGFDLI